MCLRCLLRRCDPIAPELRYGLLPSDSSDLFLSLMYRPNGMLLSSEHAALCNGLRRRIRDHEPVQWQAKALCNLSVRAKTINRGGEYGRK